MLRFACSALLVATMGCAAASEPSALPPQPAPGSDQPRAQAQAADPSLPAYPWADVALEPQDVVIAAGAGVLRGVIVKPAGDGPFPAVLWNHGSEQEVKLPRKLAKFWVAQGSVFFAPFRRGHGGSSGEWVGRHRSMPPRSGNPLVTAELERQVDDVLAGAGYLRAQRFVDPSRMVVAGCSFGGIETLLTAERETPFRAALDFAGGAMSWRANPVLSERLRVAARRTTIPVFYIQAENDFEVQPTLALSAEAKAAGRRYAAKLYPPNGTTAMEGHHLCVTRADVWGADAMAFLQPLLR